MPIKSAIQRIINKDIKELSKLNLDKLGIFVEFDENNMLKAKAIIIGPKNSPYENGILYFVIEFPTDYPYLPPKIHYLSNSRIRIHPNLYVGRSKDNYLGKVCLSVINTWSGPQWTTIMHIGSILLSIQSLLSNNPIQYEPGFEKETGIENENYNKIVTYDTFQNLIYHNYLNIPKDFECFNKVIIDHINSNKEDIQHKLKKLSEINSTIFKISCKIYNISIIINYPSLLKIFKKI